jgi:aspartyl-tRNA(Asn)/glutamyl-tRNA(Gln) amidotransferase subunit C
VSLSIEEVRRIASLARLRLSPEQEGLFARQLGRIVDYIDQLRSFEAESTAPVVSAAGPERDDQVVPGLDRAAFLANAPETLDGFLVVPQVKGGEGA